jgi:drug/metabolite transporter (DMT)-like permease
MGTCGHFLMNWAHAYTRLVTSSLLTLASPGVSVVAAALLLHEPILAVQVIGMAVVLGALGMVLWRTSREASSLARLPLATVPPTDPAVP